jgi:coproporphyrinogen III oxidase
MTPDPFFERCAAYFQDLQSRIVAAIEELDGDGKFVRDDWTREPATDDGQSPILGGWGRTRVMAEGRIFERAGIGFSFVHGRFSEEFARTMPGEGRDFFAAGVSLVFHPRNPRVPTVHMNYRRLSQGATGWFGGGADLTPYVLDEDDARHFHRVHSAACEAHPGIADYAQMKKACDEYFYLPHRREARGIGGLFFDHRSEKPEETFAFVRDAGDAFLPAYVPIVEKHCNEPYTDDERDWQLHRRGRYVEFNLLHDRGTIFGLKTGGRIESILMSMPPLVKWTYSHAPAPETNAALLVDVLREPRNWLGS